MSANAPTPRRLQAADLQDATQYRLLRDLEMDAPTEFLAGQVFKLNSASLAFYLFAAVTAVMTFAELISGRYELGDVLLQLAAAVALSILVAPVHEAIHALTYKVIGAPSVTFVFALNKGLVYTIADQFVVTGRELMLLAAVPALAINVPLALLYLALPSLALLIAGLVCLHTLACIGDIAIVNFLWPHGDEAVYSYDDEQARRSYFYVRVRENGSASDE